MDTKNCSNCGKLFQCGNPGTCWCSNLPALMPVDVDEDCLCRDCLVEIQNQKIKAFIDSTPHENILKIAAQYKSDNLIEKLDYIVEGDKWVFTKWFLLKRGFCCETGCLNCPY